MKLLALLLAFAGLALADNSVTIYDDSGSGCTNFTFQN
jgi:predicted porin